MPRLDTATGRPATIPLLLLSKPPSLACRAERTRTLSVEIPRARQALAANRDATIDVLPHANHNFFLTRTGNAHEADTVTRFAPELLGITTRWLEERVRPIASALSSRKATAPGRHIGAPSTLHTVSAAVAVSA